jgi:mandelamide amidase
MIREGVSIEALVAQFRSGAVSAEAFARRSLDRIAADPDLGAVTHLDAEHVLARARFLDRARANGDMLGPLAGIPYLAKDNIDARPYPTTAGTATLRHAVPRADAPIIDRLHASHAILLGKANMHELALGNTTTNPAFGATRNPRARDHVPGGSSGGSAAAVAAGLVPLALGTDTAASVRMPAACCGVAGLRPTVRSRDDKAYPDGGVVPCALDLDTVGPIARTVADLDYVDAALCGRSMSAMPDPASLRLGIPEQHSFDLDEGVEAVVRQCLDRLADAGVTLVPVAIPYVADAIDGFRTLLAGALAEDWPAYHGEAASKRIIAGVAAADVAALIAELAAGRPAGETLDHARGPARAATRAVYHAVLRDHRLDAMAFPTVPVTPPAIAPAGDSADRTVTVAGQEAPLITTMIRNTMIGSYLGAPGLSLPAGAWRGLPVGLELDGPCGGDAALLALGRSIEAILAGSAPQSI